MSIPTDSRGQSCRYVLLLFLLPHPLMREIELSKEHGKDERKVVHHLWAIYIYIYIYINTHIHTHTHTHTHTCYIYISCITFGSMASRESRDVCQNGGKGDAIRCSIGTCMYVCMCVCVCTETYARTWERATQLDVSPAYTHTHIHTHTHMYTHTHC